jgi:hypothetical protein
MDMDALIARKTLTDLREFCDLLGTTELLLRCYRAANVKGRRNCAAPSITQFFAGKLPVYCSLVAIFYHLP